MKKIIRFIKKHLKHIIYSVLVIAALIMGYSVLHNIATANRGYNALGGEIFVFLVPCLVYVYRRNIKDTKEVMKKSGK